MLVVSDERMEIAKKRLLLDKREFFLSFRFHVASLTAEQFHQLCVAVKQFKMPFQLACHKC